MKCLEVCIFTALIFLRASNSCLLSSHEQKPKCPKIDPFGVTSGNSHSQERQQRFIVVCDNSRDTDEMMDRMSQMKTSKNESITPENLLHVDKNGIPAIVCNLNEEQLNMVHRMDGVRYVEQDAMMESDRNTHVWGLDRIDQRELPLDNTFLPTGNGSGIIVYVVDSGINTKHVDFGGRAENWFEVMTGGGEDCLGHGTHVAGIVGGGTYGVAKAVILRSVRIFGCPGNITYTSDVVRAINYILDKGEPGVVSMSFGSRSSYIVEEAMERLAKAGFLGVASAGNDAKDVCLKSPARANDVIAVGATDEFDQRASFSNYGNGVSVFAPGVHVESLDSETRNGTTFISGTSMACPHVSGVAAILLSRGVPVNEIRQKIEDLSTKYVVRDSRSPNRLLFID